MSRGHPHFTWTDYKFSYLLYIQFHITSSSFSLAPGSAFDTRNMSSPVRQLQWQSRLDYIYVATESSVSDNNYCDYNKIAYVRVYVMGGQPFDPESRSNTGSSPS